MLNRTPVLLAANSLILLLWLIMRQNRSDPQSNDLHRLVRVEQTDTDWIVVGSKLQVHVQKPYIRRFSSPTSKWQPIKLSYTEHKLLRFLLTQRDKPQPIEVLFIHLWSDRETVNGRLRDEQKERVRRLVYQLRQKCEANPSMPEYICTVHGFGYRFDQDISQERNLQYV